jgi:hypothetical protein
MPALLLRTNIKIESILKTCAIIAFWWLICSCIWVASLIIGANSSNVARLFQLLFWIFSVSPPVILCVGLLTKKIKSRLVLKSRQFRGSLEFVLFFSILYTISNIVYTLDAKNEKENQDQLKFTALTTIISAISFIFNLFFPFIMYRTALADTKFWRGIGTKFQGGIKGGTNDILEPVHTSAAASHLQNMMSSVGRALIDFAFLKMEDMIGVGSSAKVYKGTYKGKEVAVKVTV